MIGETCCLPELVKTMYCFLICLLSPLTVDLCQERPPLMRGSPSSGSRRWPAFKEVGFDTKLCASGIVPIGVTSHCRIRCHCDGNEKNPWKIAPINNILCGDVAFGTHDFDFNRLVEEVLVFRGRLGVLRDAGMRRR
jgi:hypothetical protein